MPAFGAGGITTVDIAGGEELGRVLRLQSDGKIVLAGDTIGGSTNAFALRLQTDGSLDAGFGSGGVAVAASGAEETVSDLAFQSDGSLLIAGTRFNGVDNDVLVIRLLPDGSLDASYGDAGRAVVALGAWEAGTGAAIQADGRLVVAGVGDADLLALRLDSAGALDPSFGVTQGVAGTVAYTENGAPVVLDPDATLFDAELSAANNFSGGTLTLSRQGGANSDDQLAFDGITVTTSGADVLSAACRWAASASRVANWW
jgi:uncharacterized delta-60 repeat protein